MTRVTFALLILLISFPLTALGQEEKDDVTTIGFEDELVVGDLFNPNGEVLSVPSKPTHQSLVRAREHFLPEMFKSIEDL